MIYDWNKITIEDSGATDEEIDNGIVAALEYAKANGLTVEQMMADQHHRQKAETKAFEAAFAGWLGWPEAAQLVRTSFCLQYDG